MNMNLFFYFLVFFFLFTLTEGKTSALNSVDDYLDVVFHFKAGTPWELCNLIGVSVIETNEEVEIKLTNNPPTQSQTDLSNELLVEKTTSCLYQLTYQNSQSVLRITNDGVISGYLMYKTNQYYADHIPILYQTHQNVRLILKQKSIKLSSSGVVQATKLNSLNLMKSAAGQMVVAPQVNLDYVNNTMDDYYVELYLVADLAFSMKHGSNARDYLFEVINYVNAVYRPLGIHILLVGLEVWSDYDRINTTTDFSQLMSNLQKWRSAMTQRHDSLHLITGNFNLNSFIATGYRTGMCRWEYSLGIVVDIVSSSSVTTAMLLASMIGTNLGLDYDLPTCSCPDIACIMTQPFPFLNKLVPWSNCSLSRLFTNLKYGQSSSYCLNNIPFVVITSTVGQACGNGIIDNGEDCDPGLAGTSSQCCNKSTCKFAANAVCASERCCNKTTCQFLTAGVTCRSAKEECDLPEYCTGCSETCPDDVYSQNGLSCDSDFGTCYDGRCGSHNKQCKMLYGPSSNKADDSCYQKNTVSIQLFSYCYCVNDFLYFAGATYYYKLSPCSSENMLCGTLHCSGGSVAWPTVTLLGSNYSSVIGSNSCQHIFISTNLTGLRDPGMVPNGARCGTNKICQNSVCVPLNVTSSVTTVIPTTMPCGIISNRPHTAIPTPNVASTAIPTSNVPSTTIPTPNAPSTAIPTPNAPSTAIPTSNVPSTAIPTSNVPSAAIPTPNAPSTAIPTSNVPSAAIPTPNAPSTAIPTPNVPSTAIPTSNTPATTITSTRNKTTTCSQDYCKNGGTCYTGASNCNGDSVCCLCTTDYLLPICETRASRSMAISMTINEVYSDKYADVTSVEFNSVSKSVSNLLKDSIASISTAPIICILSQIRKGSIITDVIIKSSSTDIKNITAIGIAMSNSCQNSQQSLCANLNFSSLVENKSLYNVCPNGVATSATTCSANSYCTGDNTNAALYTCACKTGYRDSYNGINSDYQGRVCTEICVDSSCQNGGTCVEHTGNSSTCICPSDLSGKKCESLAGNSSSGGGGGDSGGNTIMIIIIVVVIVCVLVIAGGVVIGIVCYKKKCCKNEKSNKKVYESSDTYYSSNTNNNTDVYADLDEINRAASCAENYDEIGMEKADI